MKLWENEFSSFKLKKSMISSLKNHYSYLADSHQALTFAVLRTKDKTGANF